MIKTKGRGKMRRKEVKEEGIKKEEKAKKGEDDEGK